MIRALAILLMLTMSAPAFAGGGGGGDRPRRISFNAADLVVYVMLEGERRVYCLAMPHKCRPENDIPYGGNCGDVYESEPDANLFCPKNATITKLFMRPLYTCICYPSI